MNHYIQSASHDFKLFEMNDIAKYGIMTMTSKVLSPLQYKSLMYLIWKNLQKTPGQIDCVELSLSELRFALGYSKDKNCNFSHMKRKVGAVIKGLMTQELTIHDKKYDMYLSFVWIQTVGISYSKDLIKVRFNTDLARYFGQALAKDFTVVRLKYMNRLSTSSAVLLYAFFCRYQNMHVFNYGIEELTSLLTGTPDYEYKYLKRDRLIPAILEINQLTDLKVVIDENFYGHKVCSLKFVVSSAPSEDELKHCLGNQYNRRNRNIYNTDWKAQYVYDMATQKYVPRDEL